MSTVSINHIWRNKMHQQLDAFHIGGAPTELIQELHQITDAIADYDYETILESLDAIQRFINDAAFELPNETREVSTFWFDVSVYAFASLIVCALAYYLIK